MLILALESSAQAASAALCRDGEIIGETTLRCGLTHSATLLPLAQELLQSTDIPLSEVDVFAAAAGPGSFTGLRIGLSSVKGLAQSCGKPCIGVSTLEAMARGAALGMPMGGPVLLCCVMDARVKQVYNALFILENETLTRQCEDRAIPLEALAQELQAQPLPILLTGDGTGVARKALQPTLEGRLYTASEPYRWQNAVGVAFCAMEAAQRGETISPALLNARYLRLPQAERERQERLAAEAAAK